MEYKGGANEYLQYYNTVTVEQILTMENLFFLQLLADHLHKRSTAAPEGAVDWQELLALGRAHQVSGILYAQCRGVIPAEYEKQFAGEYGATLFYHIQREAMVAQLKDALRSAGIPFFIVKGVMVAACYPVPALRTMGDTDLVIHTEDRQQVHEILLAQGFVNESHFEDREWVYYKNRMEFELHDHLVYSETVNRKEHEAFFNDFWPYVHDGALDWSFHLLFLLLHLRKHLMNEGVGFRQFMDVAVVTKYCPDLDWAWIRENLEKLGMLDFARTVFAMNRAWFGIEVPLPAKEIAPAFYVEATDLVFRNGVFGFHNSENRDNRAVNVARNAGNAKLAMAHSAIRTAFPGYQTLITAPHYRFLKGKPWLLPAAWAYRILRGFSGNRLGRSVRQIRSSFASDETIEKRSSLLDQWGL